MKITRQQFLSVLGNMNLNLTEREQDTICRRYVGRLNSSEEAGMVDLLNAMNTFYSNYSNQSKRVPWRPVNPLPFSNLSSPLKYQPLPRL